MVAYQLIEAIQELRQQYLARLRLALQQLLLKVEVAVLVMDQDFNLDFRVVRVAAE